MGHRPRVVAFSLVSVLLASSAHVLGHGHLLDLASLVVAVAIAASVGLVLARRWTRGRVLVSLVAVQAVVHVLGALGADPRLTTAAQAHGHGAGQPAVATGGAGAGTMLLWHVIAVPVAALVLVAVERSASVVAALARGWARIRPIVVPALPPALAPDPRPRVPADRPHLLVSRSNAPPCPA